MQPHTLDPSHTSIGFNVKYLMITDVIGQFKTYEAEIELEENTNELKGVEANIQFPLSTRKMRSGTVI